MNFTEEQAKAIVDELTAEFGQHGWSFSCHAYLGRTTDPPWIIACDHNGTDVRQLVTSFDVDGFRRRERAALLAAPPPQDMTPHNDGPDVIGLDSAYTRQLTSGTGPHTPMYSVCYRRWIFTLMFHVLDNRLVADVHGWIMFGNADTGWHDSTIYTGHSPNQLDVALTAILGMLCEAVDRGWEHESPERQEDQRQWEAMVRAKPRAGAIVPQSMIEPTEGSTPLPDYIRRFLEEHGPLTEM